MPPKKRLIHSQTTLFGAAAPMSSSTSSCETETTTRLRRRGDVKTWRDFSQPKWKEHFPWLDVGEDGVHCIYCTKVYRTRSIWEWQQSFYQYAVCWSAPRCAQAAYRIYCTSRQHHGLPRKCRT